MSVSIRIVGPDEALGAHIEEDLKDTRRASIAVAFAKETALKALDLEKFFRRRGELRLLAGTDFWLTELELLRTLQKQATASCRVYHKSPDRGFHPKLYVLDKRKTRVVYIGSSNLTFGGLRKNFEANVRLEGPPDAPEIARAAAIFEDLYTSARATPLDRAFEVRYNELQQIQRQVMADPETQQAKHLFNVAENLFLGAYRAEVAKQRWLLVTTQKNYLAFKHASAWGRRNMNEVAGCEPGDVFLVHVTRGRGIAAMGMFEGRPYYDETPIAKPAASDLFPHRIGISLLGTLEEGLPTKDLLEPLRPRKKGWFQGYIRKSHALAEDEFRVLREAFEERRRQEEALHTAPQQVKREP
jgi:HKD family nuclease